MLPRLEGGGEGLGDLEGFHGGVPCGVVAPDGGNGGKFQGAGGCCGIYGGTGGASGPPGGTPPYPPP